jgi:hypothetical protein
MKMKHWDDCTQEQRIERWENAKRVLVQMPRHERTHHWDMMNWGYTTECGTIACAAGHCGLDPWFRRRGLKLLPKVTNDAFIGTGEFEGFSNDGPISSGGLAVAAFFGPSGARNIFFNGRKRPVSQVIKEVRAYIKQLRSEAA